MPNIGNKRKNYRIFFCILAEKVKMFRSCGLCRSQRRDSTLEDSSSCRSSEIERCGDVSPHRGNFLKIFGTMGWYRQFRKPGRGMSMTKIERSE